MGIKGMSDKYRPKKLGRIGLGVKVVVEDEHGEVKMKGGEPVTTPKALDHFVVPEEIQEICGGPAPKRLAIQFLMDRDEEVFPHALMLYSARGLICMGDGERANFRIHINPKTRDSETLIYNGVARWSAMEHNGILDLWKTEKGYGTDERIGNTVRCLYMDCPRYGPNKCRPTGMLRFAIKGIVRQGYWQMTVHLNPMVQLLSQLRHGREFIEQYCGRATIMHADWLLELTGPEKMWINGRLLDVYTPELELDPEWMQRAMEGRVKLPHMPAVTTEDVYGSEPIVTALDADLLEGLPPDPVDDEGESLNDELPF